MSILILNGSPKGNSKNSGSYLLSEAFVSKIKTPKKILSIENENDETIIDEIEKAERIVLISPNYIHSIPSRTLEFIHNLPYSKTNQSIGFIVQAGYIESDESSIILSFLKNHATKMGYNVIGTIAKGDCAGLGIIPNRYTKLLEKFSILGEKYEETDSFLEKDKLKLESIKRLSFVLSFVLRILNPLSKALGWNRILKKNNAYANRYNRPYC